METEAKSVVIKPNTPRNPPASLGAPKRALPPTPTRIATLQPVTIPAQGPTTAKAVELAAAVTGTTGAPPKVATPSWRFAKLWGVAEILRFKDGTEYKFPLIRQNNPPGYSPTSSAVITDEALATNLRNEAKKNRSIREVK